MTVAAATLLAAVVPGGEPPGPSDGRHWTVLVGALVAGAALVLLHRRPVPAVLVCLAVCTGVQLLVGGPTGLVVLVLLALLLVALRRPLRVALTLLVVCCLVYLATDLATGGWDSRVLAPLALMAACTAAGVAVAGQQALVHAATERAAAAERTRQDEADRQVADERLRIARELHDVVAHHVAVMGVQAGAAEQLLDTDRDQVRLALAQVRASGRTALAELGAVVGLLRTRSAATDDDETHDDDLRPAAAGLARLPELLASVRAAGLRLTVIPQPELPAATGLDEVADIAAYRIVQESLTNALRHGTGDAELTLEAHSGAVVITVISPLATGDRAVARQGSGHGLLGMRERAALVGAELRAGPTGYGCFAVRVRIPARRPARA
ncbi:Signal transduction histidine kinase [Geodermatophilus siccatus]|uniref:histidine kinase n=1 Tax=Geodermatophilus siccatus TaxID=1137991 RepID=A0A1G9QKE6_9ACTN|nr:Signal transduction histidine kinase [Geodermatophilus siccatus]